MTVNQSYIFLRMYSTVIGNGRTLQNDTVISGYHVPKGVSECVHYLKLNEQWVFQ